MFELTVTINAVDCKPLPEGDDLLLELQGITRQK